MGKKGNKARAQTRRSIEAGKMREFVDAINENEKNRQEEIEMERAYGRAEADGEFKDDSVKGCTAIVPWEALEDPNLIEGSGVMDGDTAFEEGEEDLIALISKFRVIIEQDHLLEYPELNFNVFVNGTLPEEAEFTEMFARSGCTKANSLDEADVCVFVGGADVDPSLYGHVRWATTTVNRVQDIRDIEVYAYCQGYGIPMVGVCRGAQFLHVMNGGILYQDVDGHVGDHSISITGTGEFIQKTPSVHHQMCAPNPTRGMRVLATANGAKHRRVWSNKDMDFIDLCGNRVDCEAFFYRDTCALGFQGHPEYSGYPAYTVWCLKMMEQHIRHNHDLDYSDDGAVLRIRPELLKERLTNIEKINEAEAKEREVEVN